jgi:hypothetical protein
MTFRTRDKNEAQSLDVNQILDRLSGRGYISGGRATAGAATHQVDLTAISVYMEGTVHQKPATEVHLQEYVSPSNPKKVVVYINTDGQYDIQDGVAERNLPDNEIRFNTYRPAPADFYGITGVPVAEIWLDAGTDEIRDQDIRSRRVSATGELYEFLAQVLEANDKFIDPAGNEHTDGVAATSDVPSDSDIIDLINNDSDHGTTAPHNYTELHGELSGVQSDQHHERYTASEAQNAVTGEVDIADLRGDSGSAGQRPEVQSDGSIDLTDVPMAEAPRIKNGSVTLAGGEPNSVSIRAAASPTVPVFITFDETPPSWSAAYAWEKSIDYRTERSTGDRYLDIDFSWVTDPGGGNDLTLNYHVYDLSPATVKGKYSDSKAIDAMTGASIFPYSVDVEDSFTLPQYNDLSNYPSPSIGDEAIVTGANANWEGGKYVYYSGQWNGPFSSGVSALSGLAIDATKDWQGKRITNLGAPQNQTDSARKAEVDQGIANHESNNSAHHSKTTSSDIDHTGISNVQSDQHHSRYSDTEALKASLGPSFTWKPTQALSQDGQRLVTRIAVDSGETLVLTRVEVFDENATIPGGVTFRVYKNGNETYRVSSNVTRGSVSNPVTTVSGQANVRFEIVNQSGEENLLSGTAKYGYLDDSNI